MFCFPKVRHVIILQNSDYTFKIRLIHVHMYA